MLKIKDNVDLKELEKFGFKLKYCMGEKLYEKFFKKGLCYKESIIIWVADKKIQITNGQVLLGTLYDLIQAGLVEKVED